MADKQPHLNGAYYSPSIPPAPHHDRRRNYICCIFSLIVAIVSLIVIAGVMTWMVFQPRAIRFSVSRAYLTQFDYDSDNNTLSYNMVFNFSAWNPNKRLSVCYQIVEANAYYENIWLSTTNVITFRNEFLQHKNETSPMNGVVFSGQQNVDFDIDRITNFNNSNTEGAFDIYVKLYFTISHRLVGSISLIRKPKAKCDIKVPLRSKGTMKYFATTNCDVDYPVYMKLTSE